MAPEKSAIFDVITYCLFGRHRGGAQRDEELLHKGAVDMSCSLTFDHFGVRYRVRRTLTKRTRRTGKLTTEEACQLDWYDADEVAWRAIDGTTSVAGLEEYVRTRLLGFDYDTFISSVLLLQGQSDKLIAADPAQRFDYLSGILEFDRYRRLCTRSEERVRELRARHDVLLHQLGQVGVPTDQQLQDAKTVAAEAEERYAKASACHLQQQQRYDRVERYHELVDRERKLTSDVQQAEAAIEHAAEIRAAAEMREKLRVALPLVKSTYSEICDAAAADEDAAAAKAKAELIDLAELQAAVSTGAADLKTATQAHEANAHELRQCRRELEHLQPSLQLAHRLNELDAQITAGGQRVASFAEQTAAIANVSAQRERLDLLYRCLTSIQAYVDARRTRDELLAGRSHRWAGHFTRRRSGPVLRRAHPPLRWTTALSRRARSTSRWPHRPRRRR
jgi:DNA repair protein SbcC/Rad50